MTDNPISDLRAKIAAIEGTTIELFAERDELAYLAHVERNAKAIKRLAEIGTELGHLENERATLEAAIAEAGRRAAATTAAEAADAERKRAEKAEPIVERLAARGQAMDLAIATYVENFKAIQNDMTELSRLGVPVPSRELIAVNANLAHDSALTPLGDKFVRPVPSTARRNFSFLLNQWALPARNWVESKLNNKPAKAA